MKIFHEKNVILFSRTYCIALDARDHNRVASLPEEARYHTALPGLPEFCTTVSERVIAIFSLAYFGQQSWSTLVMIVPADLFPTSAVGAVAGLVGFGGAMGGIAFGELVGYLLDHGFGYGVVFTMAGMLHVVAFLMILGMVPAIRPLEQGRKFEYEGAR